MQRLLSSFLITYLIFFFTLFSWASSYIGIRIGVHDFTPSELALFRYLVGTAVMLVIYVTLGKREIPQLKDVPHLCFLGLVGFAVYNLALNYGEMTVDPGTTSFIISQAPVLLTLFGSIMLGERLNRASYFGLCLSIAGVTLIAVGKSHGFHLNAGLGSLILAAVSMAVYSINQKKLLTTYHPITITTYAMIFGTLFMLYDMPALLRTIPYVSHSALMATIYLGVFPAALGYLGWAFVMNQVSAAEAAAGLYSIPIIASLLSWGFLKEKPSGIVWLGGSMALMGAILISYNIGKQRQQAEIITKEEDLAGKE